MEGYEGPYLHGEGREEALGQWGLNLEYDEEKGTGPDSFEWNVDDPDKSIMKNYIGVGTWYNNTVYYVDINGDTDGDGFLDPQYIPDPNPSKFVEYSRYLHKSK